MRYSPHQLACFACKLTLRAANDSMDRMAGGTGRCMPMVLPRHDLAEAYALTASRKDFDRALRRLLVRHATRGALLRRLTEAGLWSG